MPISDFLLHRNLYSYGKTYGSTAKIWEFIRCSHASQKLHKPHNAQHKVLACIAAIIRETNESFSYTQCCMLNSSLLVTTLRLFPENVISHDYCKQDHRDLKNVTWLYSACKKYHGSHPYFNKMCFSGTLIESGGWNKPSYVHKRRKV